MITGLRLPSLWNQPFPVPGRVDGTRGDAQTVIERLMLAQATRHIEGGIRITTDEGDTVTLSFARDAQVTYAELVRGRSGADVASSSTLRLLDVETSQEFTLEIEGDLSPEEREDIESLIKRFAGALRKFARGDLGGALERLQPKDDLESLAGFAVEFSQESSVTVARLMRRIEAPAVGAPADVVAKPTAQVLPVSTPVAEEGIATVAAPVIPDPGEPSGAEAFADKLLQAARASTVRFERLGKLLARAMNSMHDDTADPAERSRVGELLQAWRDVASRGPSDRGA